MSKGQTIYDNFESTELNISSDDLSDEFVLYDKNSYPLIITVDPITINEFSISTQKVNQGRLYTINSKNKYEHMKANIYFGESATIYPLIKLKPSEFSVSSNPFSPKMESLIRLYLTIDNCLYDSFININECELCWDVFLKNVGFNTSSVSLDFHDLSMHNSVLELVLGFNTLDFKYTSSMDKPMRLHLD
ncbi:MAG: hypothetical protein KKF65_05060 [Nanoarchaeota archaeon]|nr:hypothetical protein [Nanoarchaeota archaeon]